MSHQKLHLIGSINRHRRDEDGAVSVMNVFFMVTLAIFTGLAVDMASLISARTQLQSAADTAAHAAMYTRIDKTADEARDAAIQIARVNMPTSVYGDVLRRADIRFGTYDSATRTFSVDETSKQAVLVNADRLSANANAVSSFLLQFIGFWDWDVRTEAVFARPLLPCSGNGFYAVDRVDMQSNNAFYNGFCIHSDSRVEFNQNNFFEVNNGVRVSVPTYDDIIVPGGDYSGNTGLLEARREGGPYNLDVDAYIDDVIAGITTVGSEHWRPFVTSASIIDVTPGSGGGTGASSTSGGTTTTTTTCQNKNKCKSHKNNGNGNGNGNGNSGGDTGGDTGTDTGGDTGTDTGTDTGGDTGSNNNGNSNGGGGGNGELSMADLTEGRVHRVACSGGELSVAAETFRNVVVITDCNFSFGNGSALEDSTFITLSTDSKTIKAPQGLRIGRNDNCAVGGGAQLISKGSMRTAAKLQLYGGQIVVAGDLNFAAQGNGFGGVSVIAGGEIDGTSNSTMGLCLTGTEDFFEARQRPRMAY